MKMLFVFIIESKNNNVTYAMIDPIQMMNVELLKKDATNPNIKYITNKLGIK